MKKWGDDYKDMNYNDLIEESVYVEINVKNDLVDYLTGVSLNPNMDYTDLSFTLEYDEQYELARVFCDGEEHLVDDYGIEDLLGFVREINGLQ